MRVPTKFVLLLAAAALLLAPFGFAKKPTEPSVIDPTSLSAKYRLAEGGYLVFAVDADGRAEVAISSYTMDGGSGKVWLMDNAPVGEQDIDQFASGVFSGERGSGTGTGLGAGGGALRLLRLPGAARRGGRVRWMGARVSGQISDF